MGCNLLRASLEYSRDLALVGRWGLNGGGMLDLIIPYLDYLLRGLMRTYPSSHPEQRNSVHTHSPPSFALLVALHGPIYLHRHQAFFQFSPSYT